MASKSKSPANQNNFGNMTFINYRLNKEERDGFSKWLQKTAGDLDAELAKTMLDGNKISCSYDSEHECWVGTLTCRDEKSINHNCCITSRADNWPDSLFMCVYKAYELAANTTWRDLTAGDDLG